MLKPAILATAVALAAAACGQTSDTAKAAPAAGQDGVFKFDKTSHSVNPQYTLFGLRHLVMNNRTYAKKYAKKYPEQWKTGEEHFSRAENAFQTNQTETADAGFRAAMEQYQVILKAEQEKKAAK
ncbi:hypothetical protein [Bergeriella denitrificans]|uniref:Lipoprotein n=1 Tax=Bergeriella denitrificans TaxID=494 RepID=A0A378UI01_BERDE|nr:hypothetical protein [Bergeriella denitrificans]STZ76925.1 Uncharacterised protein [Bergeriella denitrificans]